MNPGKVRTIGHKNKSRNFSSGTVWYDTMELQVALTGKLLSDQILRSMKSICQQLRPGLFLLPF